MDILKGNLVILILLFSLSGCKRYDTDEIEKFFNLPLKDNLEFVTVDEQWNDFNGDGEKVVLFKIDKTEAKKLYIIAKAQGFKEINTNSATENFTKRELKYINGNVLYKTHFKENEVRTLVIDSLNGKVTFYYSVQ